MLEHLEKAFGPSDVADGTALGTAQARDNLAATERAAEAVASECDAMDRESFARTIAAAEGRPAVFRPDDPRLLLNAPPLRDERERREYAAFRSALSIKEHEKARELRERTEIRKRDFLHRHGVDIGLYLAYCLDAVPDFEAFFFGGQAIFRHT